MEREMWRRRLEEVTDDDFMYQLPEGVAANIFSRMPFTTVLGCFRVKKSWCDMLKRVIAAPDFAENHLDNMLKEDAIAATGFFLLIQRTKRSAHLRTYLAEYVEDYSYNKVNRLPCPKWSFHVNDHKRIVGSCNGLICLSNRISKVDFDPIFVYNPIMKEYLDLPPISNYSDKFSKEPTMASGFGFYTSDDEKVKKYYKIVRIYYRDQAAVGEVQIYTLGEGEWKTIENTEYQLHQSKGPGVLLNGSLHWLIEKKDQPVMIVAFNLSTELFSVVQPPDEIPDHHITDTWTEFKEFEGKLCIAHVSEGHIKFWILVDATWIIKELTLSLEGEFAYYTPFAFRKNMEEVLLSCTTIHTEEVLSFYNFETDTLVEVMRIQGNREQDVVMHTNSFVSLKVMGEDARRMT